MNLKPDYKKELELAAKQMILVHRMDTLIKLILRTIIRNLNVGHVGFLLYDKTKDVFVAKFSRGSGGLKIPSGFVKVNKANSLIKYFTDKSTRVLGDDYLLLSELEGFLKSKKRKPKKLKTVLEGVKFQLSLYNAVACIPGFFRDKLICILFLGQKTKQKKFTKEELGFLSVLSSDVVMAIQNAWFFQDLNKQLERNKTLFLQTVMALATAIEAKDKYTSGHTERVAKYSYFLAEELKTMKKIKSQDWNVFIENLKIASLLHDIGKIGVKEEILNKNGSLDKYERETIEQHALVGYMILRQIDELEYPLLGVKYHHERYDGHGYPEGLKGKQIPLIAQIISIADMYDALTSDRPYRKAMDKEKAAKIILEVRGKYFSPMIVDAFLRLYKKGLL
tara:strand:+ start:346 stop:1524 length:1179 start_codon:yes stop_codon:yes gene_type:complete